jgi:transcriptional regulator with XRE-family HTH domain
MGRPAIPAEAFDHGDHRRYRRGCRCEKCKAGANRANIKNRYLRQTERGLMRPADRAADHLLRLRAAGLDDKTIRSLTGICPDVMYRILRREGVIHARTEARITSVPVPNTSGTSSNRAYIPGHGTVRRLRALVAAGWYQAELARRLGKQKENLKQIIDRGETGQVAQYVADEVRALYAELHNQTPEEHGVAARFADRARTTAANRGWAPPAYWDEDDFDNPHFVPALSNNQLSKNQLGVLRRAEIAHLITFNLSHADIAARLGMSENYVRDIAREITTGVRRIRAAEGPAANPYLGAAA